MHEVAGNTNRNFVHQKKSGKEFKSFHNKYKNILLFLTRPEKMSKRQRSAPGRFNAPAAKRPIGKNLVAVSQSVTNSQTATTLFTTTFPATIVGVRWSLALIGNATASAAGKWMIVIVRDGVTADTIALSDAASVFQPEQNVLAFGDFRVGDLDVAGGIATWHNEGSTKTMRKLQGGDLLQFIALQSTANAAALTGTIQFFTKS